LKEWTTPDLRNTLSTTNLEKEEVVDALGNYGNASMPEQVNRPNPWRRMIMMISIPFAIINRVALQAYQEYNNKLPNFVSGTPNF
jgi:hypothetical protein